MYVSSLLGIDYTVEQLISFATKPNALRLSRPIAYNFTAASFSTRSYTRRRLLQVIGYRLRWDNGSPLGC